MTGSRSFTLKVSRARRGLNINAEPDFSPLRIVTQNALIVSGKDANTWRLNENGQELILDPGELSLTYVCDAVQMLDTEFGIIQARSSVARLGIVGGGLDFVMPNGHGRPLVEIANVGTVPVVIPSAFPVLALSKHTVDGRVRGSATRIDVGGKQPTRQSDLVLELSEEDGARLEVRSSTGRRYALSQREAVDIFARHEYLTSTLAPALLELRDLVLGGGTLEQQVQDFFNAYPEFILGDDYVEAVPQVVLELESGATRRPDFGMRSLSGELDDLLEIKRPDALVIKRDGSRPVLSDTVQRGVSQLVDYARVLESDAVVERAKRRYGLRLARPRLHLLVGRLNNTNELALRRAPGKEGVEITTYDQLLKRSEARIYPSRTS